MRENFGATWTSDKPNTPKQSDFSINFQPDRKSVESTTEDVYVPFLGTYLGRSFQGQINVEREKFLEHHGGWKDSVTVKVKLWCENNYSGTYRK